MAIAGMQSVVFSDSAASGGKDNSDDTHRKSRMLWRYASGPALQPFIPWGIPFPAFVNGLRFYPCLPVILGSWEGSLFHFPY